MEPLRFSNYSESHQKRLRALSGTPDWEKILSRSETIKRIKAETTIPPTSPSQFACVSQYLVKRNAERVKKLKEEGVTENKILLEALSNWETALSNHTTFPIAFLGLVVTLDCNLSPRCLYCNQIWRPRSLALDDWKTLIDEVSKPIPPYIYISGGEPLILGDEIWGDSGIVSYATQLGSAVNINTNATLIEPRVAMRLVKIGLAKLHISLDDVDPEARGELYQDPDRISPVLKGIFNIQIAREALGVSHPEIHINCALTRRNLYRFPNLLRFLLDIREKNDKKDSPIRIKDFSFHLIPVGGGENAFLRPDAGEWERFYTQTWEKAEKVWTEYQIRSSVPENQRKPLAFTVPEANPLLRVHHHLELKEYCEQASKGIYWRGALTDRCYVAPTQAFVLPDGTQHWCGAHAIQRCHSLGNVRDSSLRENIMANIHRLVAFPDDFCSGCAGATCGINQATVSNLSRRILKL